MQLPTVVRRACVVPLVLAGGALAVPVGAAQAQSQTTLPCPPGATCGAVTVPLDRANPSAGTTEIAYVLLPRTDQSRPALATIVPNPGGPGDTTTGFPLYEPAFAPLRDRRDILLIDARGTGRSGALSCPTLGAMNPLTIDKPAIGLACAKDLGARAGMYGSAEVADDIDAVRARVGADKLDLWGDSYGTFLMPVYAARHHEHVRSIVLDGAYPIASDPWGRDVLKGTRRAIALVCRRTHGCTGSHVLAGLQRLGRRLRAHPRTFTAHSPIGKIDLTIGEPELAAVTFAGGHPEIYGLLPAAVDAALHHDYALLERLVYGARAGEVEQYLIDPSLFSIAAFTATACHDYPRPYDLAASPAVRHDQYERALAALDPAQFRPFSPEAWVSTGIDAGPGCLDWPADPTAGSPLQGRPLPDVPVLVQSGDLDSNTPLEQGRAAAAQFPHATLAVIPNAGHTPDLHPCGVAMALEFIRTLKADPGKCRHDLRPPTVIGRPAQRASQLADLHVRAPAAVRRVVGVALATIADAKAAIASGGEGTLDALRGGTYVVSGPRLRFAGSRVVDDARVDGRQIGKQARLRIRGRGVPSARLTVRITGSTSRVTGTVAGRRVALRVPSAA